MPDNVDDEIRDLLGEMPGTEKPVPEEEPIDLRLEQVLKGVSATWLSKVLRKDLAQVKQRLAPVTPMSGAKNQAKYDLKTAPPHVVDPVMDVAEYILNMDASKLPPKLSEAYWRGHKNRLDTLEKAKELWPTRKVVESMGEIFKIIRQQSNLWVDTLDDHKEVSEEHRELLRELVYAMNDDIFKAITEYTEEHANRSELEWLEDYVNEHD